MIVDQIHASHFRTGHKLVKLDEADQPVASWVHPTDLTVVTAD